MGVGVCVRLSNPSLSDDPGTAGAFRLPESHKLAGPAVGARTSVLLPRVNSFDLH